MRKLKHHEGKLLRKVDFLSWKNEDNIRENTILRKYGISKREDYAKYNRIAGMVTSLVAKMKNLPQDSEFRVRSTEALLNKLFNMGLISTASNLEKAEHIPASAFCRRRLPIVMVRLKMAETVKDASTKIEQVRMALGLHTPHRLLTRRVPLRAMGADG